MNHTEMTNAIVNNQTALGIELGSTRIKAVLISTSSCAVLATGCYQWENRLENGLWTYRLEDAVAGLQQCFADLACSVQTRYGTKLSSVGTIGISGMMHGYLPLDRHGKQLSPFLTWRNTNTAAAAAALTQAFHFNVPLRWSIAHLYQAILDNREHVPQIDYLTTLAGYIHFLLTGKRVMGVGEASGMFPIDSDAMDYDAGMLDQFRALVSNRNYGWDIKDILPQVLPAGADAGCLTQAGARLLDPSGTLQPGIVMVPPEGDAGTGMVATNSVQTCTGNVSAGTSIFAMVVLEKALQKIYPDIDMVTTPCGKPVAMVHCNNGTSELDAWMKLFREVLQSVGAEDRADKLYPVLFEKSLQGSRDCDGILLYNYVSGEPVTGLISGRPLLMRQSGSELTLSNFMRSQIYSVLASLAIGIRILDSERVCIKRLTGHGGLFKTPGVAQRYLAAAMNAPVTVMSTAGEGGPYGMAILAAYREMCCKLSLADFLQDIVFAGAESRTVLPDEADRAGFAKYLDAYSAGLSVEACAVQCLPDPHHV